MGIKNKIKRNELIIRYYDSIKQFYYKRFSDEKIIKKHFKKRNNRNPDLKDPIYFNDKLQWLKLNWFDETAAQCADKLKVREHITETIGSKYLIELIDVFDSVEEINFHELPNSFVLKGTHGSGFNLICADKSKLDWDSAARTMRRWMRRNYFWKNREWVYKDIKPRIICEKYMQEENTSSLIDYKFFCFNGVVEYCQVIRGRGFEETVDFYDVEWNHMPFTGLRELPNSPNEYTIPDQYNSMIEIATKLSKNFPFVRVDLYNINGQIYFGELTFFPTSGMGEFYPQIWNRKIGELIDLNISTQ